MAGMLPGVESARRRRFRHSGGCLGSPSITPLNSTRRSSFCLYASNNESSVSSSPSLQRNMFYLSYPDVNMAGAAREAKQRLDEKFRAQRKSENKRENASKCGEGRTTSLAELHIVVYESKKSGLRKFSWTKMRWKASEQEDCAVCLESFKDGETLMHLPCEHKFHSKCLKPWLDMNSHCPCCRTAIIST